MQEINTENFHSLSQIAITIAGFAALFSLLEDRKVSKSLAYRVNLIRFFMMVELACMIAFFCFLTIIVVSYYPTEDTFKTLSWFYIPVNLGYLKICLDRNVALTNKRIIDGNNTRAVIIFSVLFALLALYNAVGYHGSNYQETYTLILFLTFLFNLYFFLRLIQFSITVEPGTPPSDTEET